MLVHLPRISLEQRVSSKPSWYCTLVRCPCGVGSPCKTYLASLLTSSKNPNQSQKPCKVALPSASERPDGWMGDTFPATCSPPLTFQKTHLPRFGVWDGESVCGHGVLPPAASKAPQLAFSYEVLRKRPTYCMISAVLGPWEHGLDLAACLDDQKKPGGSPARHRGSPG
jgi:hypothetical protein